MFHKLPAFFPWLALYIFAFTLPFWVRNFPNGTEILMSCMAWFQ